MAPGQTAAILDLDGTLVDSNYHHALAWYRAFREADVVLPIWQLHRHVGIGGDKYVAAVAGDEVEQLLGDELRRSWERHFGELLPEIQPCDGARELMVELKARGHRVVVATSAIHSHFDTFIDNKLSARELADDWTTTDDVEHSKPAPDLVTAALAKAGTRTAVNDRRHALGLSGRRSSRHPNHMPPNRGVQRRGATRRRRRGGIQITEIPR